MLDAHKLDLLWLFSIGQSEERQYKITTETPTFMIAFPPGSYQDKEWQQLEKLQMPELCGCL